MAVLELNPNNLYANGRIVLLSKGRMKLVRTKLNIKPDSSDKFHVLNERDRLTQLAWRFWHNDVEGAMFYWFVIAEMNGIRNPFDMSAFVGKTIIIPDIIRVKLQHDI